MKEAVVSPSTEVTIQSTSIPKPGPHDVLVKVVAAGINPKDWKFPKMANLTHNSGDDLAGIVEAVGSDVVSFAKGDRVAGMHKFPGPYGAFGEYAILEDYLSFHVPKEMSFEEAATMPLNVLTAAYGLFWTLGLPSPWSRAPTETIPLIIYGASTSVGAFAIKMATTAGIHPIVAVGSANSAFIKDQLDPAKGDVLLDYRAYDKNDPSALAQAIKDAFVAAGIPSGRAFHGFDTVSLPGTFDAVAKAMAGPPNETTGQKPKLATILPDTDYSTADPSTELEPTSCGFALNGGPHGWRFGATTFNMLGWGAAHGKLTGHPYEIVKGGLEGLQGALEDIMGDKVKAKKMVVRIADTPGL